MIEKRLTGRQAELARKWVPFFCGIMRGGATLPDSTHVVKLLEPAPRRLVHYTEGNLAIHFGALLVELKDAALLRFMEDGVVELDDDEHLKFPERIPDIEVISGGLRLSWKERPFIDRLIARVSGVSIEEILVYPDRIDIRMSVVEDRVIVWD